MGLLKNIISTDNAKKLISQITKIEPIKDINEKNLELKYKELLNTGTYEDLIKIIKTTYLRNENRLNNKKKVSEKDDTYFKLAEKYLYNELSISLNMSIEKVKAFFRPLGMEEKIMELPVSSATVPLAAQALGVPPCRIAKTLSFMVDDSPVLVVTAGPHRQRQIQSTIWKKGQNAFRRGSLHPGRSCGRRGLPLCGTAGSENLSGCFFTAF